MAKRKIKDIVEKERGYFGVVIPVPVWVLDGAIPYMKTNEIRMLLYVMRRTWGEGFEWAWISSTHLRKGRRYRATGATLDAGIGIDKRRSFEAIRGLLDARLIVVDAERSSLNKITRKMRPSWFHEVDWIFLRDRMDKSKNAAARMGMDDDEVLARQEWVVDNSDAVAVAVAEEARRLFFADRNIKGEIAEEDAHVLTVEAKEMVIGGGKYTPEVIKIGREAGMDPKATVAVVDAVLDACGKRELADKGGDYGDKALHEAQRVAGTLIGLGYKTRDDVDEVVAYWKKSFQGKSALQDVLKQIPEDFDGDPMELVRPQFGNIVWAATSMKSLADALGRPKRVTRNELLEAVNIEQSFTISMLGGDS